MMFNVSLIESPNAVSSHKDKAKNPTKTAHQVQSFFICELNKAELVYSEARNGTPADWTG